MLPFLKPKQLASTIIANYKKDKVMPESEENNNELMSLAESLISAIHEKDASKVANLLKELTNIEESDEE